MSDENPADVTHPVLLPRYNKGLRSRLMLFTALSVLLPTLVAGGVVVITFRRALVDLALREQTETSRRLADKVAASVEGVRRVLSTMAAQNFQDPEPPAPKPVAKAPGAKSPGAAKPVSKPRASVRKTPKRHKNAETALRRFMDNYPSVMETALVDADGRETVKVVRKGKGAVISSELLNRSDRPEVKRAMEGKATTGPIFFNAKDKYPLCFLAVPLGGGKGVLLARLSLDSLIGLVAEVCEGRDMEAFVVDPQGLLIAHPERQKVLAHEKKAADPIVQEFFESRNDFVDGGRVGADGKGDNPVLTSAHKVPGLAWLVVVQSPMKSAMGPLWDAGRRSALGVAAAGLVFLLAGLWLAHRILKPLHLLQEGVNSIAQGKLSHRLDIQTGDEIQRLADEFNGMADGLEKLEQTKRDLTHMIVHDLKSPLSSILGSLDYVMMASKEIGPEHRKLLSLGSKAGKDLLRMIQNLLDLGKMEEGKLELKREVFPLLDLAGQCVDDLEANMHREGKMVSVEIPKSLPKVWADRDLMHRVLSNLLSNALKHTSKGAEIAIRAEAVENGAALLFSVKDNGEGIPEEYLEKIFEKFGQADLRKQSFRVGTGLGLTFCKLAVESHGGRIWVESELGTGSEFFVQIPLPPPDSVKESPVFPSGKLTGPAH